MGIDIVGWDVGGAHLKAVALDPEGAIIRVVQRPCPLWLGLDKLSLAIDEISEEWPLAQTRLHAVTMTGELADSFPDRATGVRALIDRMRGMTAKSVLVFAGIAGLLEATAIGDQHLDLIASANWMASGRWLAQHLAHGILVDIGSTTTDVIPFSNGQVRTRGYTDYERLRYDELVYIGIVRTPLMAIASKAPFEGGWVSLMNEHFATSADVFRLVGALPEHADQYPAADNGCKDEAGSARRLARLIGRDLESAPLAEWIRLANFFRNTLIGRIAEVVSSKLPEPAPTRPAPLIGAGTGRFLVKAIAERLDLPYRDVVDFLPTRAGASEFSVADCLPAAAVAHLAREERWTS